VKIEASFAKVMGRAPTEAERERLYRLRDALDLADNDALWAVVMALEHYDALYRQYPARLGEETARAIEGAREAFAAAAAAEAARVQASLARQVAKASVAIARRLSDRPVSVPWVAAAAASAVLFGALCTAAGAALSSPDRPFWARGQGRGPRGLLGVLGVVLGVPAGWMVFLLLVPGAVHGAVAGWRRAREDAEAGAPSWLGWAMVAGSILGAAGCVALLAQVL
jgi:hypothetical protein